VVTQSFVVCYIFDGFLDPINMPPQTESVFRLGSTIHVRFQLLDHYGQPVHDVVASLWISKLSDTPDPGELEAVSTNDPDAGNVFREMQDRYVFNLGTRANMSEGSWRLRADLGDNCDHSVVVSIR